MEALWNILEGLATGVGVAIALGGLKFWYDQTARKYIIKILDKASQLAMQYNVENLQPQDFLIKHQPPRVMVTGIPGGVFWEVAKSKMVEQGTAVRTLDGELFILLDYLTWVQDEKTMKVMFTEGFVPKHPGDEKKGA